MQNASVEEKEYDDQFLRTLQVETYGRIVAVIPAYNESRSIFRIVQEASKRVSKVIVVDDGSQDSTGFLAQSAGAQVIRIPRNTGKGTAAPSTGSSQAGPSAKPTAVVAAAPAAR